MSAERGGVGLGVVGVGKLLLVERRGRTIGPTTTTPVAAVLRLTPSSHSSSGVLKLMVCVVRARHRHCRSNSMVVVVVAVW